LSIPTNIDAEMSVLGAVISDPELFDRLQGWVADPSAFWKVKHRKIWKAAQELARQNIKPDLISLHAKCKQKYGDEIELEYFIELQSKYLKSADVENHASLVWENHLKREVGRVGKELENASTKTDAKLADLLISYQRHVEQILNLQPNRDKSIDRIMDEAQKAIKEGTNIVEFGLPFLDHSAGGMTRGELTVIGGRPGHGKTTLMLNIVKSLVAQGLRVALFNREMTNIESIKKLIVMESKWLKYTDMRKKVLSQDVLDEIDKMTPFIKEKYSQLRMYDDVRDLDASIREIKRWEPDVFIDDYIQLTKVNNAGKRDRRFEIEDIMQDYKWIAKKTKASGILISQLNRDIERRIDPTPTMGDFAEGGTIEQLAESCHFVFYGYNFDPREYNPRMNEIIVKKARYGTIGSYKAAFNGDKCEFKPWEKESDDLP